ncbi:hypothetical protein [Streptomyces sviceus]|uniref:hypothetical protein n=1 Tax=Streptomyces sviceus TaxID=285530 RepID=UPI0036EB376B
MPEPPTWAQELLDHLRPISRDVGGVVAGLAETVDGTAALQDDSGTLVAGTPMAPNPSSNAD